MTAAATVRVSAAVSYLRLLAALVARAPNPDEAFVRARLLLKALLKIVAAQACVITGRGGSGSSVASSPTLSSDCEGVGAAAEKTRATVAAGAGVEARSAASDTVVLCMQTLKFVLDWAEQPAGGSSGSGGGGGGGSGGRSVNRATGPPPTATAAASATASAPAATRGAGAGAGLGPAATRSGDGAVEGPEVGAGYGQAPTCLHGLRARPSNGGEGAGADVGSAGLRFVCPLVERARRCEFVQDVQSVRRWFKRKQTGGFLLSVLTLYGVTRLHRIACDHNGVGRREIRALVWFVPHSVFCGGVATVVLWADSRSVLVSFPSKKG